MQSFIQYRRFGRIVEEQRLRHQCQLDGQRRLHVHDTSSSSLSGSSLSSKEEVSGATGNGLSDPEKGEIDLGNSPGGEPSTCLPDGIRVMARDPLEGVGDIQEPSVDSERTQDRPEVICC